MSSSQQSTGVIQLASGVVFDLTKTCGARKSKTSYGKDELVLFAKTLKIAPLPKTNKDLCEALRKEIKAKFGKDIKLEAVAAEKKPKKAAPAAAEKEPKKAAAAAEKPKLDASYDCKKKGKGAHTLEEFKKMAKDLHIKVGKLKKEALCEQIKKKAVAKPTPKPKTPTPKPKKPTPKPKTPAAAQSPLGYKGPSHVKIASGLVFNLDVDCKGKKTKATPHNYNRDDLHKFAKALDIKLKKTNVQSCTAIKQQVLQKFPKPAAAPATKSPAPVLKSASPTPKEPVTSKQLVEAIKKCLDLKN